MTNNAPPEREEIEHLLPWHAAKALNPHDAARVQAALDSDEELARRYARVREELAETVHVNESLGAPSAQAMRRLFAAIDADGSRSSVAREAWDIAGRVGDFLARLSPRTLAWSAGAALVVMALQAGLLTGMYVHERFGSFEIASDGRTLPGRMGTFAFVRFNPTATAAEIGHFLQNHKASVVDGPKPGGLYRIRVSATGLPQDELGKLMTRMEQEKAVVGFIAPAE